MSLAQPNSLRVDVIQAVFSAFQSNDKIQVKFASKRALNAFDRTGDLFFLAHHIHCECFLNKPIGYKMFEEAITQLGIIPNPNDVGNTYFFGFYVANSVQDIDKLLPDDSSYAKITAYTEVFINKWDHIEWPVPFLWFLFEQGDFDRVEDLCYRLIERDWQHANVFLMHVNMAQKNYVAAYNIFCQLAAAFQLEISSYSDLEHLFSAIHGSLGVYPPEQTKANVTTKAVKRRIQRISLTGAEILRLVAMQIFSDEENMNDNELSIERVVEAWQSHVAYLGPDTQEENLSGTEVAYRPDTGITTIYA